MVRDEHSIQGVLELHPKGFGFLRNAARNYIAQQADPYVPAPLIQRFGLREGLLLTGPLEAAAATAMPVTRRRRAAPGSNRTDRGAAAGPIPPSQFRRPDAHRPASSISVWKPAASR